MNPSGALRDELDAIAAAIPGTMAYAFIHPASGTQVEREADRPFIAASIIKIPILVEGARQVASGEHRWNEPVVLRDADKVAGSGVLHVLHDGLELTLRDAAVLMTVVSDNTATNVILDRLGTDRVNAFLVARGCSVTRCVRKLYDWDAIRKGIHNIICAGEIAGILVDAASGTLVAPEADRDILEIMKKQQYREKIPHLLPKGTVTASKSGSLDEVSHDAAVVWLPGGDWFVLAVFVGDLDHDEDGPERDAVNTAIARMGLACYRWAEQAGAA